LKDAEAMTDDRKTINRSIRRHLVLGVATVVFLVGGVGGWAATTQISGAVIAQGTLVVESDVKRVQHPTGGVVGEVRVREGARVKEGDLLLRLDETQTRASLAVVTKALDELAARQARLEAERDGLNKLTFSPELAERKSDAEVARVMSGEQKLFESRRTAREGQVAQLRERIAQLRDQIRGAEEQVAAKRREVDFINTELKGLRDLFQKNLVPISRLTALERDATRLDGDRAALVASIAQLKGRVTETELQIIQVGQDLRSEVGKELAEIRAKVSELVEKKVAAEDLLKRTEIRSPHEGIVHQLTVSNVGGVITPGEPIMLIVPNADALTVEARVAPQDIDKLHQDQPATLRFSAFNQQTTPEINGFVSRISADLTTDKQTGVSFYTVRLGIPPQEMVRLGGQRLVPGMPVEAFVKTEDRNVLSYLVKPLMDQAAKAFREG
jgi:HlyD family secretion protein